MKDDLGSNSDAFDVQNDFWTRIIMRKDNNAVIKSKELEKDEQRLLETKAGKTFGIDDKNSECSTKAMR